MSDIRQEWDDFYGTCCVEYCHICHNGGQLDPCPHCNFLFCTMHKSHDCIRKPKPPAPLVFEDYDQPIEVGVFSL